MPPNPHVRLSGNAELLAWQSRIRILIACIAAVAALALLAGSSTVSLEQAPHPFATVLLATQAYILLAVFTAIFARRRARVQDWLVGVTVLADLALVFSLTIAVSRPEAYDRALIVAFMILHLNTMYFGQRHAVLMLAATIGGYALLVSNAGGDTPVAWGHELWSMGAFVVAGVAVTLHQGSLRKRLDVLAQLFARAEEGDFTEAYDEDGDRHPDAITRVGRGYNRVRGQLASMVLTDPLTACVNRRGFDQALAREAARTTRAGSELALVAIDVDHFKTVNDTLGHPAGDAVLREIGALLLHTARAGDIVARTGGEEFTLVLPDTSAPGAYQLAARLCEVIREHTFRDGARGVRLTASVGVAASDAQLAGSAHDVAEALKNRADQALYAAKRGGRDRVRAWVAEDEEALVLGV